MFVKNGLSQRQFEIRHLAAQLSLPAFLRQNKWRVQRSDDSENKVQPFLKKFSNKDCNKKQGGRLVFLIDYTLYKKIELYKQVTDGLLIKIKLHSD